MTPTNWADEPDQLGRPSDLASECMGWLHSVLIPDRIHGALHVTNHGISRNLFALLYTYPTMATDQKTIHPIDLKFTQFIFENLPYLIHLSRQQHNANGWQETTPVYITCTFKLPSDEDGDDRIEISIVHGTNLPGNDLLQDWHQRCCQQSKFATHIHLACIWPGDAMCLATISPHVFAGITKVSKLSTPGVFDDWSLTGQEFKTRWPHAVNVYRGPNQ
jgi:hypothetical protein